MSKNKLCEVCGEAFVKQRMGQKVCGIKCAASYPAKKRAKVAAREYRKKSQDTTAKAAQRAVNAFIRERDYAKPCIVHGYACPYSHTGFDAGHYKSVGAHPHLRYVTWNIHKQCSAGNKGAHKWSRYEAGVDQLYEQNLRRRIGDEKVDWLNGPHEPKKYSRQDLERIRKIFSKRAKIYKTLRERGSR